MQTLTIIRGLPASGKTTLARAMKEKNPSLILCAADDFFISEAGEYRFDPKKIVDAHKDCQKRTEDALIAGLDVAVHNTFTQKWEVEPYIQIAYRTRTEIKLINLFDGGKSDFELFARNTHAVPLNVIAIMRARWEEF